MWGGRVGWCWRCGLKRFSAMLAAPFWPSCCAGQVAPKGACGCSVLCWRGAAEVAPLHRPRLVQVALFPTWWIWVVKAFHPPPSPPQVARNTLSLFDDMLDGVAEEPDGGAVRQEYITDMVQQVTAVSGGVVNERKKSERGMT